jgi:anti-sigma regulatory factor (Ser/Thr protein kinase)
MSLMDMSDRAAFRVVDRSIVAEIRRAAGARARAMGWNDTACGESEIVATEVATNLVKHARDGVVALAAAPEAPEGSLVVVAVDRGPGMTDLARSFTDGFSTSGSPGTGLGAIRRLAYETDVVSTPDGTVMVAELRNRGAAGAAAAPLPVRLAGFGVPKDGQVVSGDAWAHRWFDHRLAIMVCDGLGHGYEASKCAARAMECFAGTGWETPKQLLQLANEALRPTRGAAAAAVLIDPKERRVRFCGVGNIAGGIVADGRAQHMVSHNGIVGAASRIAEFEYAWPPRATLIMHSDGLSARWQLQRWAGIWGRHPALIAGMAYRDLARGTDDAVVVVATEHALTS